MNEEMKTDMMEILRVSLAPLISRLDGIDTRLDGIDTRLDGIEVNQIRSLALHNNSLKGRTETLCKVPNAHGIMPDIPFPPTLSHLIVAGNERLPLGDKNTWTKSKSIDLLRFYEAEDVYDSETNCEKFPAQTGKSYRHFLIAVPASSCESL